MPRTGVRRSRRSFLSGVAAAGAGLLASGTLSSCANSLVSVGGKTQVRFWNLFEGGEFPILQEMYAPFRRDHPELDLKPVTLSWGQPYYTKLAMSSTGGRSPEVAIAHLSRSKAFTDGNLLLPFDLDLLNELGITEQDFNPDLWKRGASGGKVYALPLDSHPLLAFYNVELCDKVGLLDGQGKLTGLDSPDKYLEAGRELAKASGGFGFAQGGIWRTFWTFFGQSGGTISIPKDNDPSALSFDKETAVETLEFMKKVHDGKVSPTVDGSDQYAMFVSKKAGVLFGGTWSLATLRDTDIKLDAAPFPQIFERPGAFSDSHSFVLPYQRHIDEKARLGAHQFVAHMLKVGTIWATAGHLPAYLPTRDSEEFRKMVPQSHYQEAGDNLILPPEAWFAGAGSSYDTQIEQIFQSALLGQVTSSQAVDQAISETKKMIESPSPL
jgi:multiple sugar transport system substrate-binding protein